MEKRINEMFQKFDTIGENLKQMGSHFDGIDTAIRESEVEDELSDSFFRSLYY